MSQIVFTIKALERISSLTAGGSREPSHLTYAATLPPSPRFVPDIAGENVHVTFSV